MTREYTIEENGIIWYEENGFKISFIADEANPDYQAYKATLASKLSNPSTPQAGE